jgi:hypothetical protein
MKPVGEVTCCVVDNGLFVDLAKCLGRTYKKVYYCVPSWVSPFPKMNLAMIGEGYEEIEVVDSVFNENFNDIDLFVFPDNGYGKLQLYLESIGKAVWGSRMGEELEFERDTLREEMKAKGLPVANYVVIKGMAALREYLKYKKEKCWIKINKWRGHMETFESTGYKSIENRLDELEWQLGELKYVTEFMVEDDLPDKEETGVDGYMVDGKMPDKILTGIEVKDLGYCGKIVDYKDIPEQITRFDRAFKDEFSMYGYRGFYSTEVRIGSDMKPYMTDPALRCYSEDTEILTSEGWRFFKDLNGKESVATLNPETKEIEYNFPESYQKFKHDGDMILLTSPKKTVELLVTEDHSVWAMDRDKKNLKRFEAKNLKGKLFIPRTGVWVGMELDNFILPEYNNEWSSGMNNQIKKKKHEQEKYIPMEDWLRFFAIYLGDGSCGGKWRIGIAQTDKVDEYKKILDKLPFKYKYNGNSFSISSVQLTTYLKQFGLCNKKHVPYFIKQLSPRLINIFLDTCTIADGGIHKGQRLFYTTSKILADDIQELIFKSGNVGTITERKVSGTEMTVSGKTYKRRYNQFAISERKDFQDYYLEGFGSSRENIYLKKEHYSGFVYDVTVKNHIIYVRRKGKSLWSGNCGSPPNELFQEMYTNLAEIVWEGANGNIINPKAIAPWGAEILIHSPWAMDNWQPIIFPEKYSRRIKIRNAVKINGRDFAMPQVGKLPEVGAVVGFGKTMDEAISDAKKIADTIEGYYIDIPKEAADKAKENIEGLQEIFPDFLKD